ncbi:hypothetical protein SNE40_014793 [Patella caerulea]|uniref:Uncharacterized protein n=1 Tax=Patella caerulea TaxID=87958 RepID=A0AAN8JJA1_PATCE
MKLLLRLVSTALLVQLSTTELSTSELSVDHATIVDTKQQNDIPGIFTNLLRELTKEELQALMVAQGERFTETYPGGNEIYKKNPLFNI